MQKRLYVGALAVALTALVAPLAVNRPAPGGSELSGDEEEGELEEVPPGLARKFAAMATYSPGAASLYAEGDSGTGLQTGSSTPRRAPTFPLPPSQARVTTGAG